jgi:hypothetical protein
MEKIVLELPDILDLAIFVLELALALFHIVDPLAIILLFGIDHPSASVGLAIADLALIVVSLGDEPPHAVHAIVHPKPVIVDPIIKQENPFPVSHPLREVPVVDAVPVLVRALVF